MIPTACAEIKAINLYADNTTYNGWSRFAIPSPEDGIGNGVSSHKYRRDKYRLCCAGVRSGGDGWSTRNSAERAALGTGSEKARRGGGGGYCVWLPSTTRAASLPALQPPSRRLTSRNLVHRLHSIYADPHVYVRRLLPHDVFILMYLLRKHINP